MIWWKLFGEHTNYPCIKIYGGQQNVSTRSNFWPSNLSAFWYLISVHLFCNSLWSNELNRMLIAKKKTRLNFRLSITSNDQQMHTHTYNIAVHTKHNFRFMLHFFHSCVKAMKPVVTSRTNTWFGIYTQ